MVLKKLTDSCDGIFGTMEQAIEELGIPRLKQTRPVPSYKGQLTLGDPNQYDSAMCIDVSEHLLQIFLGLSWSTQKEFYSVSWGGLHASAS